MSYPILSPLKSPESVSSDESITDFSTHKSVFNFSFDLHTCETSHKQHGDSHISSETFTNVVAIEPLITYPENFIPITEEVFDFPYDDDGGFIEKPHGSPDILSLGSGGSSRSPLSLTIETSYLQDMCAKSPPNLGITRNTSYLIADTLNNHNNIFYTPELVLTTANITKDMSNTDLVKRQKSFIIIKPLSNITQNIDQNTIEPLKNLNTSFIKLSTTANIEMSSNDIVNLTQDISQPPLLAEKASDTTFEQINVTHDKIESKCEKVEKLERVGPNDSKSDAKIANDDAKKANSTIVSKRANSQEQRKSIIKHITNISRLPSILAKNKAAVSQKKPIINSLKPPTNVTHTNNTKITTNERNSRLSLVPTQPTPSQLVRQRRSSMSCKQTSSTSIIKKQLKSNTNNNNMLPPPRSKSFVRLPQASSTPCKK